MGITRSEDGAKHSKDAVGGAMDFSSRFFPRPARGLPGRVRTPHGCAGRRSAPVRDPGCSRGGPRTGSPGSPPDGASRRSCSGPRRCARCRSAARRRPPGCRGRRPRNLQRSGRQAVDDIGHAKAVAMPPPQVAGQRESGGYRAIDVGEVEVFLAAVVQAGTHEGARAGREFLLGLEGHARAPGEMAHQGRVRRRTGLLRERDGIGSTQALYVD